MHGSRVPNGLGRQVEGIIRGCVKRVQRTGYLLGGSTPSPDPSVWSSGVFSAFSAHTLNQIQPERSVCGCVHGQ